MVKVFEKKSCVLVLTRVTVHGFRLLPNRVELMWILLKVWNEIGMSVLSKVIGTRHFYGWSHGLISRLLLLLLVLLVLLLLLQLLGLHSLFQGDSGRLWRRSGMVVEPLGLQNYASIMNLEPYSNLLSHFATWNRIPRFGTWRQKCVTGYPQWPRHDCISKIPSHSKFGHTFPKIMKSSDLNGQRTLFTWTLPRRLYINT